MSYLLMMLMMYDVTGYSDYNGDLLAVSCLSLTVRLQQHVCSNVHYIQYDNELLHN